MSDGRAWEGNWKARLYERVREQLERRESARHGARLPATMAQHSMGPA